MKTSPPSLFVRVMFILMLILPAIFFLIWMPQGSLAYAPRAGQLNVRLIGQYATCGAVYAVAYQAGHAFLGCYSLLDIADVGNPMFPIRVGSENLAGSGSGKVVDVALAGEYAYLGYDYYAQFFSVDISNVNDPVQGASCCALQSVFESLAVSGNYVYAAQGNSGLRVINISSPGSPAGGVNRDTPGYASGIAVAAGHVYLADSDSGLLVYEISNPASPNQTDVYDTVDARDVAVGGDYAYVADGSSGLRVINIADPANIYEVGFRDTPGTALRIAVSGDYAYIADGSSGLRVIDVSNPANPVEVAFYDTPGNARDLSVSGSYIYLADEDAGMAVLEVYEPTPTATSTLTRTPTRTLTPTVTRTSTPTAGPVYLPVAMRNYRTYFEGPWEAEPNNDYQYANGPLRFAQDYFGYPDDAKDYFSFYLADPANLTISLDNYTAHGVQVLLYHQTPVAGGEVARDFAPPFEIIYNAAAGWYYLYIYAAESYNHNAYTLQIQAP